ncbi:glucose-6-phosphate dehydrogenase assembly protein OpcA [Leptolyngbya sp. FACHB-671]|uniref:glucose-6-phosphate dehydrogenase assembly protein OpcA n=1 Tax=unclassified Leptolyngbya TaxID=2650499 RepID=UPI0016853A0F|nr:MULTISPECIES: glucose-6-phosphate dehydrogenase assembly protein OpcA [unclassified Leptolyngbya]MBD1999523.1 glucose-6-phosphate dehydrogenase assembly protein OpcA [Leptolyngbya sp. FACHB-541]MBD2072137.1 glucose-6-phosphate dehydrogenase assembly protein OpcA [Leptolyngbya sp. FACHB-671]
MTTPIVALQKPKDISLDEIEAELGKIWRSQSGGGATRAATFSMVVYEPEEFQQLLAALGFYDGPIDGIHGPLTKTAITEAQKIYGLRVTGRVDSETLARLREEFAKQPAERIEIPNINARGFSISDAIAAQNPCRIITLSPVLGEDEGVTAQVSAYCPIQKSSASNLICCEYITLRGTKVALERVTDLVASLMIPELPKFVWWKATPNPEQELFKRLSTSCQCLILDSCYFSDPESEFLKMQELIEARTYIADLNWHRLASWQELTAAAFDPPERRAALGEVDRVTIDYEKGNAAQALMFLGWLASRLEWEPVAFTEEGGDYDLKHVKFNGPNGRQIEAELAAIPTADWGEIPGDMVGLRLTSTNLNADCCTILCSETTGCMRMEAGGSAQACRTEQVTPMSDQRAESLLSQQLQRWGRDMLYEESLAVVAKILSLLPA